MPAAPCSGWLFNQTCFTTSGVLRFNLFSRIAKFLATLLYSSYNYYRYYNRGTIGPVQVLSVPAQGLNATDLNALITAAGYTSGATTPGNLLR